MGYREDVSVAYSSRGWELLVEAIGSELLTDAEREDVVGFLDSADDHSVNDAGDHCLAWESIKTYADDSVVLFQKLHTHFNTNFPEEYYCVMLGEDGATDINGSWYDNPFNLGVVHQLTVDVDSCKTWKTSGITIQQKMNVAQQDDYTCGCGNTKCSTQEKSCWKCGAPIHKT